jgi:hypothetical protein
MNNRILKNSLLLLLILFAGAAAGAWAMRLYFDRTLMSWNPTDRFVMKLDQDLKLTVDQRDKVTAILMEQKSRMEDLRGQWRLQVQTLDREGEDRIARILAPGQGDQFMRIHDQIHGRMDRFLWTTEVGPTAIAVSPSGK